MQPNFFSPSSIAIIGASIDTKKLGSMIVANIKNSGYTGRIYPINNKSTEDTFLYDLRMYQNINEIHETPELVIISIPTDFVFEELLKSYAAGVRNFVIITAGFKEIGNNDAERFINQFIDTHPDAHILGPNCLGFIDTQTPLNASFAASFPNQGKISFFSQSGALCTAVLDWSEKINMGFAKFVSLGNKNNISENTFLSQDFLQNAPAFFYLESFVNGKEFLNKARNITSPLVLLNPGRYSETTSAMQSHTGSIASNNKVVDEALEEAGIIRAYGLEDIMDLMMLFNFYPSYQSIQHVAIVSNAGGPGIITTDCIKDYGLDLAVLSEQTKKQLATKLPRTANIHNPVDVVGDALADRYSYALDTVLSDPGVDAVIVLLTPQSMTQIDLTAESIQRLAKIHKKVVIASFMGGKKVDKYEQYLFKYGIPYFDYPERAVWALSKLNKPKSITSKNTTASITIDSHDTPLAAIQKLFKIPRETVITDTTELISYLPNTKIALKLISDQMWHKTDSGGVKLHLDTDAKRLEAYNSLISIGDHIREQNPTFEYRIQAQEMVSIDQELFLGVKKDVNFGNVVVFGLGGIYANIINENMLFLAYASRDFILEKIKKSKTGQIIAGARGQSGIDLNIVTDAILNMHTLITQFPQISEIDINPLGVVAGELYAVDIKVKLEEK